MPLGGMGHTAMPPEAHPLNNPGRAIHKHNKMLQTFGHLGFGIVRNDTESLIYQSGVFDYKVKSEMVNGRSPKNRCQAKI